MNNPNALQTENQKSRAERFAELDTHINQNLAEIKRAFANISKTDLPSDWVDQSGFEQFIKSRGIILTSADKTGLLVLGTVFGAGAILSPQTIFDVLTKFNPARNAEAVNA